MLRKLTAATAPLAIFAVNCAIAWRLLRAEYLDQFPSIEGAFISLARYIKLHWPLYDWFPLWFGGYPFPRSYQPALHYSVAVFSALSGWNVPRSYHFIAGIAYSLAAVGFFCLTLVLSRSRTVAFCGALLFSLFSPSLIFFPLIRQDAGGLWCARRFQSLVQYGEGPNNTGVMIGLFALTLFHVACTRRARLVMFGAAAAVALVIATNWPATIALCIALTAYVIAMRRKEILERLPVMLQVALIAVALALPFALPSTILSTFFNADSMHEGSTPGVSKWLLLIALALVLAASRSILLLMRVSFEIRFAVLNLMVLSWIVFSASWLRIFLVPQPMRFHIALEIPAVLLAILFAREILQRFPNLVLPVVAAFAVFCCLQFVNYRHSARVLTRPVNIRTSLESEESTWIDGYMNGERVLVPGTVSLWLNAFTDTPELTGCCEQSLINPTGPMMNYTTARGYRSDAESSYYSLLWMKAWAVRAVAIGGPHTREQYKSFASPNRFQGRLPVAWESGDDRIYRVPSRAPGLVRIVKDSDFVVHRPVNGIDDRELKTFVAALDDARLPLVQSVWPNPGAADISGDLTPGQAISVAVNYDPGWTAMVNGTRQTVQSDGLRLIKLEPHCSGTCNVLLRWSPGLEPTLVCWWSILVLLGCGLWMSFSAKNPTATAAPHVRIHFHQRAIRPAHGATHARYSAVLYTTGFRNTPTPSISTSTTSPGLSANVFPGVPV